MSDITADYQGTPAITREAHDLAVADLERQLAEAQVKLSRIETDMCTCNRGLVGMCIAHDKSSLLARILKEEK